MMEKRPMSKLSRREFLSISTKLCAMMGLGAGAVPQMAEALGQLAAGNPPVLWLQGLSCSGCSVSFLNSEDPGPAEILTKFISLMFHSTLSTATGDTAMKIVQETTQRGEFFLVVEGSIPAGMPEACLMGHEPVSALVSRAARKAQIVIAIGSCAAFGGIPAADNNPTGAISVPAFLKNEGITVPTIVLPGCPCHPDWFVGTLAHVLKFGGPELDDLGRPKVFFGKIVHEQCPRFTDYEREKFARTFSQDGCLFKLGCLGPNTRADCTLRYWNSRTNTCIKAGSPCIGCASESFAKKADFPFFTKTVGASLPNK